MNLLNYISIVQILIFTVYLFIVFKKFGVLPSISQSFYEFEKVKYSSAFVIFSWSIGGGMFFQSVYDWKESTEMIFLVSGFLLCVVSIASMYRIKKVGTIHYLVSVGAICSGFWAIINQDWPHWYGFVPLAVFIGFVVWMKVKKIANFTTWAEVAAFYSIFVRLIFKP